MCKIEYCKFIEVGDTDGASVLIYDFDRVKISNCFIINNVNAIQTNSSPVIVNNVICNNYAGNRGGGIFAKNSSPVIMNNIICNNYAPNVGGGLYLRDMTPMAKIINNVVCNNEAGSFGGGFYCDNNNTAIRNNIVRGNKSGGADDQFYINDPTLVPAFYYNNIQDGKAGFGLEVGSTFEGIYQQNIDVDPYFTNPSSGAGIDFPGHSADWSIADSSLCINAGDPDAHNYGLPAQDIFGNKRISHGFIDIGAFEYHNNKLIINNGNITENTGWFADTIVINDLVEIDSSVYLTIGAGTFVYVNPYQHINVLGGLKAEGRQGEHIYFVTDSTGYSKGTHDYWWGFHFLNNAVDSSVLRYCFIAFAEKGWGGAVNAQEYPNLVIENCTIKHNFASNNGGAIHLKQSNAVIRNCSIIFNDAAENGGGIYCNKCNPLIENNIISYNQCFSTSLIGGCGGLGLNHANGIIRNNVISYNQSKGAAGVLFKESNAYFYNNIVANNTAGSNGGGMYFHFWNPNIVCNLICNNKAERGGGLYVEKAFPNIVNNTVCNNYADSSGGGIYFTAESTPGIINTIIYGNMAGSDPSQAYIHNASIPVFRNNNIQGGKDDINVNFAPLDFTYQNNIDSIPYFVDPTPGKGPSFDAESADWTINSFSPCINKGLEDTTGLMLPTYDEEDYHRINDVIIDIGAIENQGGLPVITEQPKDYIKCAADSVKFTINHEDTCHYKWAFDEITNIISTDSSYVIDSLTTGHQGNYACILTNAYGSVISDAAFLLVNSAPEMLFQSEGQFARKDYPVSIEAIPSGTPPMMFQWFRDGDTLIGETGPELFTANFTSNDEGVYRCRITNQCGSILSVPIKVFLAPEICMVSVDTSTNSNLIIWEKVSSAPITSYNVYRESVVKDVYELLGNVSIDSLSVFTDTAADPTVQAYKYKITALDSAGNESDIAYSPHQKTMHLVVSDKQGQSGTNLQWNAYEGFDFPTYYIYRSEDRDSYTLVHSISSGSYYNSWTDSYFSNEVLRYFISIEKADSCKPAEFAKASSGPFSQSLSNLEDNGITDTRIAEISSKNNKLHIVPNPMSDKTIITINNKQISEIRITGIAGRTIYYKTGIHTDRFEISKTGMNLSPGCYFIELTGKERYTGKLIVH